MVVVTNTICHDLALSRGGMLCLIYRSGTVKPPLGLETISVNYEVCGFAEIP